jgi:hypothetical protein
MAVKSAPIEQQNFIKEVKEELKFMGYLYIDLSRLTYIGLSRIKAILSYNLTATDEEILSIKKVLGLE